MNRKRKKRLLIVAFVVAVLVVVAHSTEHPDVPYRVMPDSATIASDHLDLRGRWREVVMYPAVSNALAAADVDAAEFRGEPGWRILIPLTTGRNTVLALTPSHGDDAQPVLWGASFAGWRRLVLHFLLATRWIPGLGRLEVAPGGSKYLQLGSKRHPSDWKVGFAMRDNVLLAALSTDGDAVRELEARADSKSPVAPVFGAGAPWLTAGTKLHRFWFGGQWLSAAFGEPVEAWISALSPDSLSIGGHAPTPKWLAEYIPEDSRITGANSKAATLAADSAFLRIHLPRRAAARYLGEILRPIPPPSAMEPEEDAVAYLTGAPYNGSLFGVRIPALTLLCPGVRLSRENVAGGVRSIFGNSKYPALLENIDRKSRVLVPIRWQKGNALFKTYPQENGVVELNRVSHGFTFCSAMMSYEAQGRAEPSPSRPPWRIWLERCLDQAALGGSTPVCFATMDLAPAADEIRQILALSRIAVMAGALVLDADETALINSVANFLHGYTPSGRLAVMISQEGGGSLAIEAAAFADTIQ